MEYLVADRNRIHSSSAGTGATPTKPGSATFAAARRDRKSCELEGRASQPGETGYLTIQKPWPSMLRETIYGDDERYAREYWQVRGTRRRCGAMQQGWFCVLGASMM